jgi:hypothetical protein
MSPKPARKTTSSYASGQSFSELMNRISVFALKHLSLDTMLTSHIELLRQ